MIKTTRSSQSVYFGKHQQLKADAGDWFVVRKIAKPGNQWCLYINLTKQQRDQHLLDSTFSRLADTYYVDCKTKQRAISYLEHLVKTSGLQQYTCAKCLKPFWENPAVVMDNGANLWCKECGDKETEPKPFYWTGEEWLEILTLGWEKECDDGGYWHRDCSYFKRLHDGSLYPTIGVLHGSQIKYMTESQAEKRGAPQNAPEKE